MRIQDLLNLAAVFHAVRPCPLFFLLSLALLPVPSPATPDRALTVDEQFLGSNDTGYAILRTETDNLGSYYGYRTKCYLDEYTKHLDDTVRNDNIIAARTRSRLFLDVNTSIDPHHNDPSTPPAKTEKVNERDNTISLAEILAQYPQRPVKWSESMFKKLTVDQTAGIYLGHFNVLWGGTIIQKVFGSPSPEIAWRLEEVMQDNCLYLRVDLGEDAEARQSRWICLSSRQTRDHLDLKPVYISAGTYETEKEAIEKAHALLEKGAVLEIWTMSKNTNKTYYVITTGPLDSADTEDEFRTREKKLGVPLAPQNSVNFQEKIPIPRPKPPPSR